jgi:hypothetical protein
MSRRLAAVVLVSVGLVVCVWCVAPTENAVLDHRIPKASAVPNSDAWRKVPNIRVRADVVEVRALSIRQGRKVKTPAELRRLLVALPRTDWGFGRQVSCYLPSIVGLQADETAVQANFRWVAEVLQQLDVGATVVR